MVESQSSAEPYYGCDAQNETRSSMFSVQGIDCSKYQSDFGWRDAYEKGNIKFAFVRATVGYGDVDSKFESYWEQMCDLDIMRGAYHFAYPKSVSTTIAKDAEDEANFFADTVGEAEAQWGNGLSAGSVMPLVLDYEQKTPWSHEENREWIVTFIQTLQRATHRGVIIYTGDNVWRTQLGGDPSLTGLPLWVPHYSNGRVPSMTPWTRWLIWQWSGGGNGDIYQQLTGKPFPGAVNGGSVDVNAWWGTLEQLKKLGDPNFDEWLLDDAGNMGDNPYAAGGPSEPINPPTGPDLVIKGSNASATNEDIFRRIRDGGALPYEVTLADGGRFIGRCKSLRIFDTKANLWTEASLDETRSVQFNRGRG